MTKKEFERVQRFFGDRNYKPTSGHIMIAVECPQIVEYHQTCFKGAVDFYAEITINGNNFDIQWKDKNMSIHFKWVKSINIWEMKYKWKDIGGKRESILNYLLNK
jgi:hypothetical protein